MKQTELLAPAGNPDMLRAAVQSGADAVYLGADKFSARAGAENFDINRLGEWIDYCHLRGVKVHLAANTLIKERERADFISYISEAYAQGIDAVIIQDLGMALKIKELMPDLDLHASTQMTVTTAEGVKELQKHGFSRVVLARELTKNEIYDIRQKTDAELELFVHGAICYSYSGQCLMSSIIGRRSGNRGLCAQPCRLMYELSGGRKGYLLSPKDLCLIDEIAELSQMGIDSFKIEGRLKSDRYVATAVGVYKKALSGTEVTERDTKALLDVFNRSGFTKGWYGGGRDMMSGDSPSNIADGITNAEYEKFTADNANFRKVNVDIFAELKEGEPLSVTIIDCDGNAITETGTVKSEKARSAPLSADRISAQLAKLGDTVYTANSVETAIDEGVIIPISEINTVRRLAAEQLSKIRTDVKRAKPDAYTAEKRINTHGDMYITAVCTTLEQAKAAARCDVKRIVAPRSVIKNIETDIDLAELMPSIGTGNEPFTNTIMVQNIAQVGVHSDGKIIGGHRLNITNSESAEAYRSFDAVTLSPELNLKDIAEISASVPLEVIAYGRLPLMLMRRCPSKCGGKGGMTLLDRRGERFPIKCGDGCISELMNSKPIYMADKLSDLKEAGVNGLQLWFYDESADTVIDIIGIYKGEGKTEPPADFTRGHFYRGFL